MISRLAGARVAGHVVVAVLAGLLAVLASSAMPQRHLVQGWLIDATAAGRAAVFGSRPLESGNVLVVTLGDRSLDSREFAGMPRPLFSPVWAALTQAALAGGARTIAFDFIMGYDASRLRIEGQAPLRTYDNPFLRLLHTQGRQGRIILGRSTRVLPAERFVQVAGAGQLGLVEAPLDPGNVVRRVPSGLTADDGTVLPTLSGLSLRAAGIDPPDQTYVVPPGPLDTIRNVELIDVLRCSDQQRLEELFRGRSVFVGSALSGEDRLKGPDHLIGGSRLRRSEPAGSSAEGPCALPGGEHRSGSGNVPGVFLHAAAADAVLSGWAPVALPVTYRLVLTGIAAAAAAAFAVSGKLRWSIPALVLLSVVVFGGGVVLLERGVLLDSADPVLMVFAAFVAGWATRIAILGRQARVIRREFGRYLAPALIDRMIDSRTMPELGGDSREITMMFADLSGFTRLSSEIPEKQLVRILNRYLDICAGVVQGSGGYVDKFIGDAVMAFWNAPLEDPEHARQAVAAGLRMAREVERVNHASMAAGVPGLGIKVAINTGPAIVGNIGSRDRMNYTVVGSAVNAAARMEALPDVFRTPVIIGESTARAVAEDFVLLPVASVDLEGFSGAREIYAPLAPADEATPSLLGLVADYGRARRLAAAGRTGQAAELFGQLAAADWPGAGPAGVMLASLGEPGTAGTAAPIPAAEPLGL